MHEVRSRPINKLNTMQFHVILALVVRHVPLSDQIRAAIDASEFSRAEICRQIELDPGVMSRFMSGQCRLAMATLDRLGRLLEMRIECRRSDGRSKR